MKKITASIVSLSLSLFMVSCNDDYSDIPMQKSLSAENILNSQTQKEENNYENKEIGNYLVDMDISGETAQNPVRRVDISGETAQNPVRRMDISGETAQNPVRRMDISGETAQNPVRRVDISGETAQNPVRRMDISGETAQNPVR